jgi:hypothetical protein
MESAKDFARKVTGYATADIVQLIETRDAATEAKVREEYAGLVESAKTLATGLQNDIWGDINDYNCAVSDVLVALAALEGKVSQ